MLLYNQIMPKVSKYLLSIFLLALATFFLSPHFSPVRAQNIECPTTSNVWYNQDPCTFRDKVTGGDQNEIFGERYTFAQVNWIINSIAVMLSPANGIDATGLNLITCYLFQTTTPPGGTCPTASGPNSRWGIYAQLGIPGFLIGGITELTTAPVASGLAQIGTTLQKFDLASPALAQGGGYGFQSLNGLQLLWGASRNMAYLIMVILLIATGFMIMFRVKINPQTAVSLQIMIPKVIFTLLLVTFSYAIAGLVIDLVYVVLAFVLSGLALTGAINPGDLPNSVGWFFTPDFGKIFGYYLVGFLVQLVAGGLTALLGVGLATLIPPIAPFIGGLGTIFALFEIILAVVVIWLLFKVWWMMAKTYLTLMFLIVVGPWQIMLGLLPGQQGFGTWIRNVIANASVFLTVPIMFILNLYFWTFMSPFNPLGATTGITADLPDFPLFGGIGVGQGSIFGFLIGFAILSMIPKVADMIRDALKVPPFKYGNAFGEALLPITGFRDQQNAAAGSARDFEIKALRERLAVNANDAAAQARLNALIGQQQNAAMQSALGKNFFGF